MSYAERGSARLWVGGRGGSRNKYLGGLSPRAEANTGFSDEEGFFFTTTPSNFFPTPPLDYYNFGGRQLEHKNILKSGTARHMFGRTTSKSGMAMAVLAVLVAPRLGPTYPNCLFAA